jgi:hypothetical protein
MGRARRLPSPIPTRTSVSIVVVDVDGGGDLDLVCPGKSGLFLVENLTKGPGIAASRRQAVNYMDKGQP